MARFVSYRDKVTDTVLGPVTVRRAWYHCAQCGHGVVPRDRELGTEHASLSPGLRSMTAHAATAVPFAKAAALLEELAGIRLTVKRAERSAEADGAAARAAAEDGVSRDPGQEGDPGPAPRPAARHPLHRSRRHRRADDGGRDRRAGPARATTGGRIPAR